jgi:hypothetical protein
MIVHAALVFAIYCLMFLRRKAAVRAGNARISQFRENREEPSESLFVRNNLANQFELPILFHVVCLALYVTNGATFLAVSVAWVFSLSRLLHTWIHVTSNRIRYRQPAFSLGFLCVVLLWILLAIHLAASGAGA